MTQLKLAPHSRADRQIIEIWQEGEMIGVIYPSDDGVKIVSKYFGPCTLLDPPTILDVKNPPALSVRIRSDS